MRLLPLALGLLSALMAGAQSPHYRIAAPATWVLEQPISGARVADTACLEGGAEIVLLDRQYDLASQSVYRRRAERLTSSEGVQNGSRFEVAFDPSFQKLTIHHLRIVRGGQVIDKLDPGQLRVLHREEDMSSFLYDGSLTVVGDLKDVRVGDIVDYAFTLTGWNPADKGRFHRQLSMGFSAPVARLHTRIIAPPGRSPVFKIHLFEEEPEVRTTARGTETIWNLGPLPCLQMDDGAPSWYDPFPAVEVSEFATVEDLRSWALDQFAVERDISGTLAARVAVIKALPDLMGRIDSAVNLVQREVRYLGLEDGISAYRPHPPLQVYEQRFGDCKDKSLLLVTVLEAVGVKAYPALVHSNTGRNLEGNLPRPGLFNHCIAMIPVDGDTLWVDATSMHNRGHGKGRYTPNYGKALVVGEGFHGYTTMQVNDTGIVSVVERIRLDTLGGGGDLVVEARYEGRRADGIRAEFASQSLTDIAKGYTDYYADIYGICDPLEALRFMDDPVANTFTTVEHYRIRQAWDTLVDRGVTVFNTLAYYVRDHQVKPGSAARTAPFALGEPLRIRHRIEVTLPEGWNVEPTTKELEGHGIQYTSVITDEGDRLVVIDHTYSSDLEFIEASDAEAYQELQDAIAEDLSFEFSQPIAGASTGSPDAWGKWLFIAFCLGACLYGAFWLYRYDPPPHAEAFGRQPWAIGSFLILPAIGICLSPLRLLWDMFSDDMAFFHATDYTSYVSTDHPVLVDLAMHFSQLMGFAQLAFTVVLAVLFFQRRSSVPLLMKVLYAGTLAWLCVDFWIYEAMGLEELLGEPYGAKEITRAFIAAAIWVPVFHLSERVRLTFNRQLDPFAQLPPAMEPPPPPPTDPGPPSELPG